MERVDSAQTRQTGFLDRERTDSFAVRFSDEAEIEQWEQTSLPEGPVHVFRVRQLGERGEGLR